MLNIWYAMIYFLSAATGIFIVILLGRKDVYKTNIFFILMTLTSMLGLVFGGLNYLIKDETIRILFHELKQIYLMFSPPLYFLYIYKFFNGSTKKLKLLTWVLISISVVLFVVALTNPYHHIFKAALTVENRGNYTMVETVPGPLYYPISIYQLGLYIVVIILTAESLRKFGKMNAKSLMLIALMGAPFLVYVFYHIFSGLTSFDYSTPLTPLILIIATLFLDKTNFSSMVPVVKESIINRISVPLFALNADYTVVYANDAAVSILSVKSAMQLNDFLAKDNQYRLFNDKKIYINGKYYHIDYSVVNDKYGEIISHLFILSDITQLHDIMEDLESLSYHDPLTKIYNRRYLFDKFDFDAMKKNIVVTVLDIDNFKQINDRSGHSEGDYYLMKMAGIIKENVDDNGFGTSFRFGGDEFLIIMMDITEGFVINVLDKIKLAFEELGQSASFGFVHEEKEDFKDIDVLIRLADERMYERKKSKGKFLMTVDLSKKS